MLFKVHTSCFKFRCLIVGTGKVKVHIDDEETILSLPGEITVDKADNEIHKIRISNINAKGIVIGPVLKGYITEIESWGDLDIIWLKKIFLGNNLREVSVPDHIPKTLKNLSYLLYDSGISIIKGMEKWDTSHVTQMRHMFQGATNFNQDISGWDTSSVQDMSYMFYEAKEFNQDISNWDINNLEDLTGMLIGTDKLDPEISMHFINRFANSRFRIKV